MVLYAPERSEALVRLRLREWRLSRAMTQDQLAAASGVSKVTIVRLEAGRHEPEPATIGKLARALRIDPADLVIRE